MEVRGRRQKAAAGDRPLFQGTAEEVAGDVRRYAALGVTHFVFDPTHQDIAGVLANMERFAEDVRPRLKRAPAAGHPRSTPASRTPRR
jgi:alkanesulfonate monooxygenase SsuD/methylene tetrahydromethanopterin reductase-like flavin-dependent oxidoreductase (luciferase family)